MDEVPSIRKKKAKTGDQDWLNMNARIPAEVKKRIKLFCAGRNLKIQDFVLYCITEILSRYDREIKKADAAN